MSRCPVCPVSYSSNSPHLETRDSHNSLVADGTPRDCSSNGCGSQADTSIIRDREIASGEVGPLGRTEGNGPVDPAVMIAAFMGGNNAVPVNNGTGTGVEDNIPNNIGDAAKHRRNAARTARRAAQRQHSTSKRQFGKLLGGLLGGGGGNDAKGEKTEQPEETSVAASAGEGATSGLPTASDDGVVTVMYRQVCNSHSRMTFSY